MTVMSVVSHTVIAVMSAIMLKIIMTDSYSLIGSLHILIFKCKNNPPVPASCDGFNYIIF